MKQGTIQVNTRMKCGWRTGRGLYFVARALFLTAMTIGLCTNLRAQASPDVHAVAQKVDKYYNGLHSLRVHFAESYDGLGMNRSESGVLILRKPGRMRWDYESPAGKVFLIDGKFAWFYTQGSPQVQRIPAKRLDDLRSPLSLLLGHTQLEKEFTGLRLEQNSQNQNTFVLTGQPKGQENRVRHVSLTIARSSGAITAIEIEEVDGALTHFTFTGDQPNVAVPESAFRFTPPAGITVVDALPPA